MLSIKKLIKHSLLIILCLVFTAGVSTNALAQDNDGMINYGVKAILPENQIDDNATYFNLRMKPEQKQILEVEVQNISDESLELEIKTISASSNMNGIIDYMTPNIKDDSLKYPFSDIAAVETPDLILAPMETKIVKIHINMPKDNYDGTILGGIFISKQLDEQEQAEGVSIVSKFSYIIGVVLTETDIEVQPDFELVSVKPELVDYSPALVHSIRNKESSIAKNISLNIKVFRAGNDIPVLEHTHEMVEMAPNSLMPYYIEWPEGSMAPGKYLSQVQIKQNERDWYFETPFEVKPQQVKEIIEQSVTSYISQPQLIPQWAILLLILLAIVVIMLIVVFVKIHKNNKS